MDVGEALRTKTGSRLRNLWSSVSIPLPVAMLLGAILIPLLVGTSSGGVFQSLSKGFGNNLGYFAIVILSAFFIAGWISTQGSASFGKFGITLAGCWNGLSRYGLRLSCPNCGATQEVHCDRMLLRVQASDARRPTDHWDWTRSQHS